MKFRRADKFRRTRIAERFAVCWIVLLASSAVAQQPQVIRLWPDGAAGSENWVFAETVTVGRDDNRVIGNVRDPTLSVFLPDIDIATGAAVVIAPGGALRVLAFDNEGVKVAQWLNGKGIAAFVLKYRTLQQDPNRRPKAIPGMRGEVASPRQELLIRNANANPAPDDDALMEVLELAIADAAQALRVVRSNAAEWGVDPSRVGLMGFSAGGGVAIGTALRGYSDAMPDFLVSLYGPSLMDVHPPDRAMPLFIAVGGSHFNVTNGCLALFDAWRSAGKSAEIHVYDGISSGFGMTQLGLPVDTWTDRLLDWMVAKDLTSRQ